MIWLLGASTGGLQAVQQFLSKVPVSNEVAFIYVQHIAVEQIDTLLRLIESQTGWPARQAVTGQLIKPGSVTLISPKFETRLSKQGWMLRFNSRWSGHYAPSIDQLAARLALVYKRNCGVIIFTGMGDDGAKGCQQSRTAVAKSGFKTLQTAPLQQCLKQLCSVTVLILWATQAS